MDNSIHVAVGVIRLGGQILIAKRPEHVHQGGFWEFPGGKVEAGEDIEQALRRELSEELNIDCSGFSPLIQIPYQYPQKKVFLDVYWVESFSGEARGHEGQEIRWVAQEKLAEYQFPAANAPILKAIQLPRIYAISPAQNCSGFLLKLKDKLESGLSLLQFRLHESINDECLQQLLKLQAQYHFTIHFNSYTWRHILTPEQQQQVLKAEKDKAKVGLHYTCPDLHRKMENPFQGGVSASCHHKEDIVLANELAVDFIVLSPVFVTKSHPDSEAMGWDSFSQLVKSAQIPVYALGGMMSEQLPEAIQNGAQGIAAISGIWEK